MLLLFIDTDPTDESRALIRDIAARFQGKVETVEEVAKPTPTSPNTVIRGTGGRPLPEGALAEGWGDPTDALLPPEPVRATYDLLASMPPDLLADIERIRGLTIPQEPTYTPVPPFTEEPSGEVRTTSPTEIGARPAVPRQEGPTGE
jgi:hypothetical protein